MKATLDDTSYGQQDACADWFASAIRGDEEAAARLYQYCIPKMQRWLAVRLPDHTSEEVAHDAMVTAFRKYDRFRPGTLFLPWVKTIAWRLAQNQMRDSTRRHERDQAYAEHHQLFSSDDKTSEEFKYAALFHSFSILPESQRHLLHLHYWEGHTSQAIADTQGRTRVAVAVNLHRICQRLRKHLKRAEDDNLVMDEQSVAHLAL